MSSTVTDYSDVVLPWPWPRTRRKTRPPPWLPKVESTSLPFRRYPDRFSLGTSLVVSVKSNHFLLLFFVRPLLVIDTNFSRLPTSRTRVFLARHTVYRQVILWTFLHRPRVDSLTPQVSKQFCLSRGLVVPVSVPSFDIGLLLCHKLLKTLHLALTQLYWTGTSFTVQWEFVWKRPSKGVKTRDKTKLVKRIQSNN